MSTLSVNNVSEVGGAPVITSGVLDSGSLPTGTVLQVVSSFDDTETDISTTSYSDFPLSVTITPSSTSSKILLLCSVKRIVDQTASTSGYFFAALASPNAAGTVITDSRIFFRNSGSSALFDFPLSFSYLDSPATTSAKTYTLVALVNTGFVRFNYGSLTAIEVAG